ncbi:hypothetical protein ACTFIV_007219 [Dictyostelium citrinum]
MSNSTITDYSDLGNKLDLQINIISPPDDSILRFTATQLNSNSIITAVISLILGLRFSEIESLSNPPPSVINLSFDVPDTFDDENQLEIEYIIKQISYITDNKW